jgi:hypothetical protein
MAIYNPLVLYPTSGIGVEISATNRFSWQFSSDNGEVQTNYQLKVWTLADVLVYDSTLTNSTNQYHDVPSETFTADVVYKWKPTTDSKTTNQYAIFKALDAGSVSIDTLPDPFIYQFYTFGATYTQSQGIKVKEYIFNLYDDSDILLFSSGTIVGETPSFEFTGLENSTTYKAECQVVNQLDVASTSSKVSFTTDYTIPDTPDLAQARADIPTNSIVLDWSAVVTQIGSVDGTYNYTNDGVWGYCLNLDEGSELIYDLETVTPAIFTEIKYIKLPIDFNGPIIKFFNNDIAEYEIGYIANTQKFYLKRGSRFTSGLPYTLDGNWLKVSIKPNSFSYEVSGALIEIR